MQREQELIGNYGLGIRLSQTGVDKTLHVLVEEEGDIRGEWARIAAQKGLAMRGFEEPEAFLAMLLEFPENSRFYFDQDFGDRRGVGVELAKATRGLFPKAHIQIVTNYPRNCFLQELATGLINEASGKYPAPFENPAYAKFEALFRQQDWTWIPTRWPMMFIGLLLLPTLAHAADFEATLQSLVTGVIGRILPIFALYHCGEAAFAWTQDKPEAKDKMKTVAVGTVALLGINAVWAWLRSNVR